ncbi:MAG: hypothetical protein QNL12_03710 [Acidimicrobiia bacterium]|nr:hypothetical protein [Acidimicrobiia bacterium]MDX2466396.1 hypothetical protein [Acidimicrobiia bacterium]
MSPVATLIRDLAAIQNQLIALPDDAFTERFELLRRQEQLRLEAEEHAAGADRERPTEDLRAELASLRLQRGDQPSGPRLVARIDNRIDRLKAILGDRGLAAC